MKKVFLTIMSLVLTLAPLSFTQAQTARLQVIHNAADPGAAVVDVYVNGDLTLEDFAFRAATPFIDVPAGVELNIGVAAPNTSADDILANFPVTLEANQTYVAIANGVLDQNNFSSNPDGINITFNIFAKDYIREQARWSRYVDLIVFHGATDAPGVDVFLKGWWNRKIVDDLSYGEFSRYRTVYPRDYELSITPANDNNTVVTKLDIDLSPLKGGSAIVFASGFLNPAANNNGAAFGLFAALADGTVLDLNPQAPGEGMARLQVIHNAADPGAEIVDVYVNGALTLEDFEFRNATPFIDVPAGVELNIGVAAPNTSADDILANFPVTLEANETYVAMANGVLSPNNFAENPDAMPIAFNVFPKDDIVEKSKYNRLVQLIAFHGATDAPTVDVRLKYSWLNLPVFDDLTYGEYSSYRWLPPYQYKLDITPGNDKNTTVVSFDVDLRGLGGSSAVVFASGFLSPSDNQNGPGFALLAALADGTVVEFPVFGSESLAAVAKGENDLLPDQFSLNQNYPNPFNPTTNISFNLPTASDVTIKVYNVLGQEVRVLKEGSMEAGEHIIEFDANGLSSGVYFYRLEAGSFSDTKKMMLMK